MPKFYFLTQSQHIKFYKSVFKQKERMNNAHSFYVKLVLKENSKNPGGDRLVMEANLHRADFYADLLERKE